MAISVLGRQFAIAEVKADAELAGQIEQGSRLRPRHLALEKAVDLGLVLDVPARKERRQRQFRIDDQVAAACARLAHQGHQPRHHLRPRLRLAIGPSWPAATFTNLATRLSFSLLGSHRDRAYRAARRAHSLAVRHDAQPGGTAASTMRKVPTTNCNLARLRLRWIDAEKRSTQDVERAGCGRHGHIPDLLRSV